MWEGPFDDCSSIVAMVPSEHMVEYSQRTVVSVCMNNLFRVRVRVRVRVS